MIKIEKSIVIDAPVEAVFAYTTDPRHLPEFSVEVDIDEVKDVRRLPDGRYTCTTVGKFLGLRVEGKMEQVTVVPNELAVANAHSRLGNLTMSLRFEPLAGGKTRVSGVDEWTLRGGPLAKLGEALLARYLDHGADLTMAKLKARVEAEALAATPS